MHAVGAEKESEQILCLDVGTHEQTVASSLTIPGGSCCGGVEKFGRADTLIQQASHAGANVHNVAHLPIYRPSH